MELNLELAAIIKLGNKTDVFSSGTNKIIAKEEAIQ